jgi:hypothetical protein
MKMAPDAAKAPMETAAVLAMAPVAMAMVAPANVVMVAPAPVAMAAAAVSPVACGNGGIGAREVVGAPVPWIRQKVEHIA